MPQLDDAFVAGRMPERLRLYWTKGKGAAKIRWSMPGDWARCVRQLRRHFPTDPKGLCANLHKDALGVWPGQEDGGRRGHAHALDADVLLACAPMLGDVWYGPLAPIGSPTGDGRIFQADANIDFATFPLPLRFQEVAARGHDGAVTVGRIMGASVGPDEHGQMWMWGYGDWLPEEVQPKVALAKTLVAGGVAGPSVDPDLYQASLVAGPDGRRYEQVSSARIRAATLVSIPAFADLRLTMASEVDESDELDEDVSDEDTPTEVAEPETQEPRDRSLDDGFTETDCGCDDFTADTEAFAVNGSGWKGLTIAPRQAEFDNDDAVKRIAQWAGVGQGSTDVAKLNKAFMWRNPAESAEIVQSYRLPVGDIIDGKLVLIYHAIYAAAALISGAHGGLPSVPEKDKKTLKRVITDIYGKLSEEFGELIKAPWGEEGTMSHSEDNMALVAAAGPPANKNVFANPQLPKFTSPPRYENGRVFGHIARWGACHMAVGDSCKKPPRSATNYAYFTTGEVVTASGETARVGRITLAGGHASTALGIIPAMAHYDESGAAKFAVGVGEDAHGIWYSGVPLVGTTDEDIAALRLNPLSGDWRRVGGNLELIAALSVNVPGYMDEVRVFEGETHALVASAGVDIVDCAHQHDDVPTEVDDGEGQRARGLQLEVLMQEDRGSRLRQLIGEEKR